MDINKQNRIVLSLTEREAEQLMALVAFTPIGVCQLADALCSDLSDLGVTASGSTNTALKKALKVVW